MTIGLILDDERTYSDITWVEYPKTSNICVTRSPIDFIWYMRNIPAFTTEDFITWVSFDHDLAWYNKSGRDITGYDCLKWLCRYLDRHPDKTIPQVFFHSKNPIGVANMKGYWYNWVNQRGQNDE
ncbi:hypothetical protein EKK58_11250 [Candidatus Dependentiae bacterium]|nr:MAG: hypothetical protein EKK58_11250 [Candidatus Dependentiae bacterium]